MISNTALTSRLSLSDTPSQIAHCAQVNFSSDLRVPSGAGEPSARDLPDVDASRDTVCGSPLLRRLGLPTLAQAQVEREMRMWPAMPPPLSGPLAKKTPSSHWIQELFLRLHRVMYWKYL